MYPFPQSFTNLPFCSCYAFQSKLQRATIAKTDLFLALLFIPSQPRLWGYKYEKKNLIHKQVPAYQCTTLPVRLTLIVHLILNSTPFVQVITYAIKIKVEALVMPGLGNGSVSRRLAEEACTSVFGSPASTQNTKCGRTCLQPQPWKAEDWRGLGSASLVSPQALG